MPQAVDVDREPDWAAQDSAACWEAYIAHCREGHLRGDPVPAMFRSRREADR